MVYIYGNILYTSPMETLWGLLKGPPKKSLPGFFSTRQTRQTHLLHTHSVFSTATGPSAWSWSAWSIWTAWRSAEPVAGTWKKVTFFSRRFFLSGTFPGCHKNQLGPSKVLKIFKFSRVGILRLGKMRDSDFQENSKNDPKKGEIWIFCVSLGKSRGWDLTKTSHSFDENQHDITWLHPPPRTPDCSSQSQDFT